MKLTVLKIISRTLSKEGTTLAELLVSALIMGYVLSVIVIAFAQNSILDQSNGNLTIATSHADHVLEGIRGAPFSTLLTSINSGDWNCSTSSANNWNCTTSPNYSYFQAVTSLNGESITTSASGTTLLTVTVTVNWNDLRQRAQSKTIQTQVGGS